MSYLAIMNIKDLGSNKQKLWTYVIYLLTILINPFNL